MVNESDLQDLPEVRALVGRLVALQKEAKLSQGDLVRRLFCSKSQVSRFMSGKQHPTWDEFVLPLAAVVGEHRKRPMSARELHELRRLHEEATLARAGRNRGLRLVREQLAELRTSNTRYKQRVALFSVAAFVLALVYGIDASNELTKGATRAHGDTPEVITECVPLPSEATSVPAACARTQWRWSAPSAGNGIKTTFDLRTRHDTGELGGVLRLNTTCETTVRWSITIQIAGAGTSELSAGTLTARAPVTIYAPLHRDARTMTFAAHRVDAGTCAATLVWDRPQPAINY
ncbi:helix-turn-helix transcriptional regulator [Streptomyces sp. NPDC006332]|uniref:helix-turn-helix domain-containing protein n=1 Tax=Streptomyces sp. NPDC006332 TaxID=3155456 RepID=UPI0033A85100